MPTPFGVGVLMSVRVLGRTFLTMSTSHVSFFIKFAVAIINGQYTNFIKTDLMKTKILSLMLTMVSVLILSSCSEDIDRPGGGNLKQSSVTLNVGESAQLGFTGEESAWEIGNPKIASVTSDGVVTGLHVGKTNLRVNWSYCDITVKSLNNLYLDPCVSDFSLNSESIKNTMVYQQNLNNTHKLSYDAFKVNNTLIVDGIVSVEDESDKETPYKLLFYPELSPENLADVKDPLSKAVSRYVYMFGDNGKLTGVGVIMDSKNQEFLTKYLSDRYCSTSKENEYVSIDGNVLVKTDFIDDKITDVNNNTKVYIEDAYLVAMYVPNSQLKADEDIFAEIKTCIENSIGISNVDNNTPVKRKEFDVIFTATEGGAIDVKNIKGESIAELNGKMIEYGKLYLSAIVNPDYKFGGWGEKKENGDISIVSYKAIDTLTVTDKINYVACFAKPFEVKVSVADENQGSAKVSSPTENDKTSLNVTEYEKLTFEAIPAEGFQFKEWQDAAGNVVNKPVKFEETFKEAVEYKAIFEEAIYSVIVKVEGEGEISGVIVEGEEKIEIKKDENEEGALKDNVQYGKQIVLTAVEKEGSEFVFTSWRSKDEDISTAKEFTLTITQDTVINAQFKKIEYNITTKAGKGGKVSAGKKVTINGKFEIIATPDKGYMFDKWVSKDKVIPKLEKSKNAAYIYMYEPDTLNINVSQDSTITALFKPLPCDVSISVIGDGKVSGASKLVNGKDAQYLYVDGRMNQLYYGDTIKAFVSTNEPNFKNWRLSKYKEWEQTFEDETKAPEDKKGIVSGADVSTQRVYIAVLTPEEFKYDEWFTDDETGKRVKRVVRKTTTSYYNAVIEKEALSAKITANNGGKIVGRSYSRVETGEKLTITSQPNTGYEFDYWTINGNKLEGEAAEEKFMIKTTEKNEKGEEVEIEKLEKTITTITTEAGDVITITKNYINKTEESVLTTRNIYANVEVEAFFKLTKIEVKVISGSEEGGVVSVISGATQNEDNTYLIDYNSQITIQATPADGYLFKSWNVGDEVVSSNNPYTTAKIIDEGKEYKAIFVKQEEVVE